MSLQFSIWRSVVAILSINSVLRIEMRCTSYLTQRANYFFSFYLVTLVMKVKQVLLVLLNSASCDRIAITCYLRLKTSVCLFLHVSSTMVV